MTQVTYKELRVPEPATPQYYQIGITEADLEEILDKAGQFGVDLREVRVVHVDDEPELLKDSQRWLAPQLKEYHAFTDPNEALEYIASHSRDIDFLIFDQLITKDLSRIEGRQGTDLLKTLVDSNIIIPSLIFSGSHAKAECFGVLEALNKATTVEQYMGEIRILRTGNFAPVAYVPKSDGLKDLLLNMVGLIVMDRAALRRGYDDFFKALKPRDSPGPRTDMVQLAYEKARTLYRKAAEFAQDFARDIPEADIWDTKFNDRFSALLLERRIPYSALAEW